SFDNTPAGIAALAAWATSLAAVLVVVEATGAYERAAAAGLTDAGLDVAVVNPRQVRDFARATGTLAKTDGVARRGVARSGRARLGPLDRKQAAALAGRAGLAPFADDSGTRRGGRRVRGGRADVRTALYMAAVTARRCNPAIRAFAARLEAAGKCFKVVITA